MNTQIIKNCCSVSYLEMMRLQAEQSDNWTFKFPLNKERYIPIEEKFPKLSLIGTEVVKEPITEAISCSILHSMPMHLYP